MDFQSYSRRTLQALCKKNKIPANITNVAMAQALQNLPVVEGMDEIQDFMTPMKKTLATPKPTTAVRTSARISARKTPAKVEGLSVRTTRRTSTKKVENIGLPLIPAPPADCMAMKKLEDSMDAVPQHLEETVEEVVNSVLPEIDDVIVKFGTIVVQDNPAESCLSTMEDGPNGNVVDQPLYEIPCSESNDFVADDVDTTQSPFQSDALSGETVVGDVLPVNQVVSDVVVDETMVDVASAGKPIVGDDVAFSGEAIVGDVLPVTHVVNDIVGDEAVVDVVSAGEPIVGEDVAFSGETVVGDVLPVTHVVSDVVGDEAVVDVVSAGEPIVGEDVAFSGETVVGDVLPVTHVVSDVGDEAVVDVVSAGEPIVGDVVTLSGETVVGDVLPVAHVVSDVVVDEAVVDVVSTVEPAIVDNAVAVVAVVDGSVAAEVSTFEEANIDNTADKKLKEATEDVPTELDTSTITTKQSFLILEENSQQSAVTKANEVVAPAAVVGKENDAALQGRTEMNNKSMRQLKSELKAKLAVKSGAKSKLAALDDGKNVRCALTTVRENLQKSSI